MEKKLFRGYITQIVAICMGMFHLISGIWGSPNSVAFRFIHLTGMMLIILMSKPFSKKYGRLSSIIDLTMAATLIAVLCYILGDLTNFINRAGSPCSLDIVMGTIFLLILLELARRATGGVMVLIALFFFGQNCFASYLPGFLHRKSLSYSNMVDFVFMRIDGVIGSPIQTMSSYVVLFMIFAALLAETKAGDFFIDLATAITGKSRGGPAKAAVVASGCFGSISGSAIANVAGTGCVTIPLMKRVGYDADFAGAVEAVASTGGQIMPPMMGAAAFILAQNVGIPYVKVAACAALPAILYYLAVFFMVDFRAGKIGLQGTPEDAMPDLRKTFREGWMLILPIILIVYLMAIGKSAQFSALFATLSLIMVSFAHKKTRVDGRGLVRALTNGIKDTAGVSVTAGAAGIIIGGITNTGLNLIFANQIMKLCGGILPLALVMIAVVSLILGMGMTTTAVYITVATIMAPALIKMGVNVLAAHLFCFYFGCICTITPPVALASFTAAGISGGNPTKTGWISFRLGATAYIVPFIFVYQPALIMQEGSVFSITIAAVTAAIGCWALSAALEGYCKRTIKAWERILWAVSGLLMMIPGIYTDLIGIGILALMYFLQGKSSGIVRTNP
ncbi:TRAP transporter fused permease subunit [Faecalicatena sp. BF-R-105]|nr:TRAP transporter fused permease subunit [Faecalicatena sp. BF-R-105]